MRRQGLVIAGLPPVGLYLAIAVVVALALSSSFVGMYELWQQGTHQHGLVVLPAAVWLMWRDGPSLRYEGYRPALSALVVLTVVLVVWMVGSMANVAGLEHLAALSAIPVTFLVLAGWRMALSLWFPLAFIVLALPVSDLLVPTLMGITADISEALLVLTGVPFLRDGQYISLPGGEFVVAEVCSGVRYFTAGLLTLLLFSYLSYRHWAKRALLLVLGCGLLIFANGLRAYTTMVVASATNMRLLGGADHIYFGWVLFGVAIFGLLTVGGRFADADEPSSADREPGVTERHTDWRPVVILAAAMLIATLNPLQSQMIQYTKLALAGLLAGVVLWSIRRSLRRQTISDETRTAGIAPLAAAGVAALVLIVGAAWFARDVARQEIPHRLNTSFAVDPGCREVSLGLLPWQPKVVAASQQAQVNFRCGTHPVAVFAASFERALGGGELVSGAHRLWPQNLLSTSGRPVDSGGASRREVQISLDQERWLVWTWYEVAGSTTSSPARAKLLQVCALVARRPAGGSLYLVASRIDSGGVAAARARLAGLSLSEAIAE